MEEPFFANGYVRVLYRFLLAEGLSAAELFDQTGCAESDLMRADYKMPFTAQMRFTANTLACAELGLGLRIGYQLQLAAHGALGTAVQSASDLKTALNTFADLIAVRASFFAIELVETKQVTSINIQVNELPQELVPFFTESILHALTHSIRFYTGQQESIDSIQFEYIEPAYAAGYTTAFGTSVKFGANQTKVVFPTAWLTLPSPEADPVIYAQSVQRCRAEIDERRQEEDVVRTIENFLLENPGVLWTLDDIAPVFSASPRTLLRRLRVAGTTYQTVRDDVLKQQAATYLRSMSVEATALSLGFADTSSFRRSFKRWFGVPPSVYLA